MMMTRDQWLLRLIDAARPKFKKLDAEIPDAVRATLSPPHRRFKKIGLCWSANSVKDKGREIWISSEVEKPIEVAGVLVHELCHSALPHEVGHKKPFITLARALHLEGKPTATTIGKPFIEVWDPIIKKIGPMPGAKFMGSFTIKKQDTPKMVNVTCPECEFFAKVRKDQMRRGRLVCPVDKERMLMRCEMMEDDE